MKKITLKSVMAVLVALFSLNANAYDVEIDGIYYNLNKKAKTAEVAYGEYPSHVDIPEIFEYEGIVYTVTSIGEGAFSYLDGDRLLSGLFITSIKIPRSIKTIGVDAFSNTKITKVEIEDLAAWLNISFGKEYYGNASAHPFWGSYGGQLFLNGEEIKDLVIPEGTTTINEYVFYGCKSLTSVNIPNSVTSIGNNAFEGCSGLNSLSIPNSVTSIDANAFEGCSNLPSVTVPNSVTSIGNYAFNGCSALTSVTIGYNVLRLGEQTFSGCSALKDVYCYTEWVPSANGNTFASSQIHTTLHVPETLIKKYEDREPWYNFGKIVALTEEEIIANGGTNPYEKVNPDMKKSYNFQSKQNGYYMNLSANGISISEKPCELRFEEAGDGKYYITDGIYYVGIAGTDNWSMSSDADKKEALEVSSTIIDGQVYYSFSESLGMVGVDWPKKNNMGCWADKKTSDGDAVLWLVKEVDSSDAIEDVKVADGDYQIYTIDGKRVGTLQKGVNIIRYTNGKVKKVFVK